jgi:hypothetical protein
MTAMAAREAWQLQCSLGLWDEKEGADSFAAFRHAAAWEACGVDSFRAMQQRHYLPALARFRELCGASRQAADIRARTLGDGSRRALGALRRECAEKCEKCLRG